VDDRQLTRVAGIGDARSRWFHEAFGVRTLSQLAELDPGEIEQRLRAGTTRGVLPARRQIERWIDDAGRLATAGEADEPWRELGSFVLQIEARGDGRRTVAHRVEEDHTRCFDGLAPTELREWIAERLAPRPAPEPASAPSAAPAAAAGVDELRLTASVRDPAGGPPINVIRRTDPWRVRCEWYVDGPGAAALTGKWRLALLGEGQGTGIEFEQPAPSLIALDGRTGPANPYVFAFDLAPGAINLLGRPQAVLDLTVALTHVSGAGTPGSIAAFADLDKVLVFRDD
jgi:predicted flap endonuclease-1-like 5' DNA nuclease